MSLDVGVSARYTKIILYFFIRVISKWIAVYNADYIGRNKEVFINEKNFIIRFK